MDISKIENIIGYSFSDKSIVERAFTHPTKCRDSENNYQSYEFLGDSILNFVIAKYLLQNHKKSNEGELTKQRASLVSKKPVGEISEKLNLMQFVEVGRGENKGLICSQTKIKCDIFESLVCAIYLDSGSMDVAESFILSHMDKLIDQSKKVLSDDYKSILNEKCSKGGREIVYNEISRTGPAHNPVFEIEVLIDGCSYGFGHGKSIKEGEQMSAKVALAKLKKEKTAKSKKQ